jgi:Cu2+-exporting ATPase
MRRGILIKDGSALERLSTADLALLDKTGTATLGRLDPSNLPNTGSEQAILAALAQASRHPLARSVTCALEGTKPASGEKLTEVAGMGVEGMFDGVRWRFGRPDWVGTGRQGGTTVAAFGPEGGDARLVGFADALRPDALRAMVEMEALGLEARLISGDDPAVVEDIATRMGIDWKARVTPAGKNELVLAERANGRRILMVGDGLNDGPALKAADVAMAPAAASDVGQMAADLVFFGDSLEAIPVAVRASRRTMRIIKQNFALAIAYNVLAVPLAIVGAVTPLIAALAMSGSSILVVANALRLRSAAK